jgi:hypothetical protein
MRKLPVRGLSTAYARAELCIRIARRCGKYAAERTVYQIRAYARRYEVVVVAFIQYIIRGVKLLYFQVFLLM